MKTKPVKLLFLLISLGMFLFSGCSNDEPNGIDTDLMNSLTRGTISTCYELISFDIYQKPDKPNAGWEHLDLSDWVGYSCPSPSRMLIHDGKTWSPIELFNLIQGWHPLYYPWIAYQNKIESAVTVYVTRPFQFDSQNNSLQLDGRDYEVETANDNEMTLIYYSKYISEVPGTDKYIMRYKKSSADMNSLSKNPFFESDKEAKLGIIELLRNELGNLFNINPYIEPYVSFPNPLVNLDRIEEIVNDGNDWDPMYQDNIFLPVPEDAE
ncbi:MAG: hypothetical protein K2J82_03760 [Muribaculaceae bacterium]|nr:hypothetical protein [Muribaculaceae bacterium]